MLNPHCLLAKVCPVTQLFAPCPASASSLLLLGTSRRPCGHQGGETQNLSDSSWLRREPSAEGSTSLFPGMLGQEHCVTEVSETIQALIFLSSTEEGQVKKPENRKANQLAHFYRSRLMKELDWVDSADVLLHEYKWTQASSSTAKRLQLCWTLTEFSQWGLFVSFEISLNGPSQVPNW